MLSPIAIAEVARIIQFLSPWIAFLASTPLSLLMVCQPSGNNSMWLHEAFGYAHRGRFRVNDLRLARTSSGSSGGGSGSGVG
jgi:hypothetical protein